MRDWLEIRTSSAFCCVFLFGQPAADRINSYCQISSKKSNFYLIMAQTSPTKKSPVNVKTHQEALGFLFGRNLSTFDHLLPVKPSVSSTLEPKPGSSSSGIGTLDLSLLDLDKTDIIMPTKLDIVCHWMFISDEKRKASPSKRFSFDEKTSILWKVTENLINFWKDHGSKELR